MLPFVRTHRGRVVRRGPNALLIRAACLVGLFETLVTAASISFFLVRLTTPFFNALRSIKFAVARTRNSLKISYSLAESHFYFTASVWIGKMVRFTIYQKELVSPRLTRCLHSFELHIPSSSTTRSAIFFTTYTWTLQYDFNVACNFVIPWGVRVLALFSRSVLDCAQLRDNCWM